MSNFSYTDHIGDNVTTTFPFSFVGQDRGYINDSDIKVFINGLEVLYVLSGENQVTITPAPDAQAVIRIRRIMDKSLPYADFSRGNSFTQDLLNKSFLQTLYVYHEFLDGFVDEFPFQLKGVLDLGGNNIINLARSVENGQAVEHSQLEELYDILEFYSEDSQLAAALAGENSDVSIAGVAAKRVANRVRAPFDDYIDVEELGIPADGTDQTVAIQDIIDSYDGVGAKIKLLIRENLKFRLKDLSHSVFSDLTIKHGYSDDLSEPTEGLIGDSGIETTYTDKAVAGIADNYAGGYHSAPYHPAMVLDCRSDVPSPLVSSAQRQTMINGTYAIHREGRTKLQITYRDFDRQAGGLLETIAGKSGIDITLWREIYTTTGITSASWVSPPVAGNLVETSTGKIFVVASINGSGMTLYHRQGSLLVGEALIFNGVTSSTTITSRVRTSASKLNCLCVNAFNSATGVNLPPERLANVNFGIGGTAGIEKGSGSVYGTAEPIWYQVDNLATPTKGFFTRYNVTTIWHEVRNVVTGAVMQTTSPTGTLHVSGGVSPASYSLTQLRTQAHPVNTDGKRLGKQVIYVNDGLPVYAKGPLASDGWQYANGALLTLADIGP